MLVQLAVLDRPDALVFVREGLMPLSDVDDAEPTDAERDPRCGVGADVVGPAVAHDVGHVLQHLLGHDLRRLAGELDDTTDPTHPLHYKDGIAERPS